MTKDERLQAELRKLYICRDEAMRRNDFYWMSINQKKIDGLKEEIERAKQSKPLRLSEVLSDYGDDVKNKVYKALLKISLAADFANECAEDARELLAKLDLKDFSLRADVEGLCELSQKIASFVVLPRQTVLTDMICDNSEFIDTCAEAADKHLKKKLKL